MYQSRPWLSYLLLAVAILLPNANHFALGQEDNSESDFDRLLPRHQLRHYRHQPIRAPHQQQQQQQLPAEAVDDETVVARRSFPNGNMKNCVSCAGRDLFLNFTKEELRVEILRKLGMRAPPEVAAKKIMPKHVVRHLVNIFIFYFFILFLKFWEIFRTQVLMVFDYRIVKFLKNILFIRN